MTGVLDRIVASKRHEVEALLERAIPRSARVPLDATRALRRGPGDPLRLICEHKKKSPSAGALSRTLGPAERALAYAEAGAAMISVLTDGPFFDGSWDDLVAIRSALDAAGHHTPLLAKEFVLHERQIAMAQASGADAVLLIVRILEGDALPTLVVHARALGLEPLVEVATEDEVERAVAAGATLVGVNARDLDTLAMDAERASRVLAAIPASCVPLYLSGLKGDTDVRRVASSRAHGALVGETLMREEDPRPLLRAMLAAARG